VATYAQFIVEFPEFAGSDPAFVQAKMNVATLEVDATIWQDLYDQGVYLTTAQKLARAPSGNSGKLVNKDGTTVYDDDLDRYRTMVTGGIRVAGQCIDAPSYLGSPYAITGATNASPIVLTLPSTAGLASGQVALVSSVVGNVAANGTWTITVVDSTHVSLNGSIGNGVYVSGGSLQLLL
jgi:hypothetical protein